MIPFWHFFWLLEYPEYANGDCWNQKNYIKYWIFLFWPALECAQYPKADQNMQQLLQCKTFFEKENKSFHFFVCINLSAVQVTWIALQSFLFSKTIFFSPVQVPLYLTYLPIKLHHTSSTTYTSILCADFSTAWCADFLLVALLLQKNIYAVQFTLQIAARVCWKLCLNNWKISFSHADDIFGRKI